MAVSNEEAILPVSDQDAGAVRKRRFSSRKNETETRPNFESKQANKPKRDAWWKVRLFRGMIDDVRRRAPYYASDWLDAWDYRIVPATVYMYFAK